MTCPKCGGATYEEGTPCSDCWLLERDEKTILDARALTVAWLRARARDYETPPAGRYRLQWAALADDIADRLARGEDLEWAAKQAGQLGQRGNKSPEEKPSDGAE